jgi:hypothetical protein
MAASFNKIDGLMDELGNLLNDPALYFEKQRSDFCRLGSFSDEI